MKRNLGLWAGAAVLVLVSGGAQAELFDRGGGMIYDSTLNLTWLADVNYAKTSGYAEANATGGYNSFSIYASGQMGWDAAQVWVQGLSYGGFDDWRLPTITQNDSTCTSSGAWGCSGGELSHLFVTDLGEKAYEAVYKQTGDTPQQIANQALFINLGKEGGTGVLYFWTGTVKSSNSSLAYYFDASQALQNFSNKSRSTYVMAVREGDVGAVPEPSALALMLGGLGLLGFVGRRRGSGLRP